MPLLKSKARSRTCFIHVRTGRRVVLGAVGGRHVGEVLERKLSMLAISSWMNGTSSPNCLSCFASSWRRCNTARTAPKASSAAIADAHLPSACRPAAHRTVSGSG
ncbi:hypothetical protein GUJ93_ZPchr0011g28554 [Zizania palustris]|uniref:Uncharacterized protein n=1 Tax=Zizania palustris TaxID=103762 RepID=A0A8J5WFH0_ZIZPA|nr:hypothetical protein GUJ93_ZPchr0011g28554 [Zizania palustris]